MAINLTKGGNINLAKEAPSVTKFRVGLGWDTNRFNTGSQFDLDVSAFILKTVDGKQKLVSDGHFVFYNNPTSVDGSVAHTGDNRTGSATGDDESLLIDLSKIDPSATEVSIVVTIHEATQRGQNFGQVDNAYCKIYNDATGEVLANYSLTDDYSVETALQFASLYKDGTGNWRFKAIGAGYSMGLDAFVAEYA